MGRQPVGLLLQEVELADEVFRQVAPGPPLELIGRDGRVAPLLVFPHHPLVDLHDPRVALVELPVALQAQPRVDPVGDARNPGLVGHDDADGALEQLFGVEDVVNFFLLDDAVRVDPRARRVELLAHEGVVGRNPVVQLPLEILGHVRDGGRVDPVGSALEADVFHEEALDRGVSGALPEAEQRAVRSRASVKPGGRGIDEDLVEVVVAVPFEQAARHSGVVDEGAHQAGNTARKRCARIRNAEAQGVAQPHLDVDPAFFAELHELDGERDAETVNVRPRDVFKVAARLDALVQGGPHDRKVLLECTRPVQLELEKDVVVGNRRQDSRLGETRVHHELQILLDRADPAGDLRVPVFLRATHVERFPVFVRVEEELGLADHAVGSGHPVQKIEDDLDLLDRIRGARLLAVPEGRVRDEDVLRRVDRLDLAVEVNPRDVFVGEDLAHEVRLRHIGQVVLPELRVLMLQNPFLGIPSGHGTTSSVPFRPSRTARGAAGYPVPKARRS